MTDKKVLIFGYGRAGKRHAALAKDFGLDVYVYDPMNPDLPLQDFVVYDPIFDLKDINFRKFDYVVICTPPDLHLGQIKEALDGGAKAILCEKPLCGIGQLDEAKALPMDAPVMVAYNYNYHPQLIAAKGKATRFIMNFSQHRADLPEWGLLLDHCSHDLDIARMITGNDLEILRVDKKASGAIRDWWIETSMGQIHESVTTEMTDRFAEIHCSQRDKDIVIEIGPNPSMFTAMWQAFLAGDYYPDLAEAIKTQELIEQCYKLNKEQNQ